jgi:hypothetical protein
MVSSGLLRRVALVITYVSEAPGSSETSVLTRATQRNNPEDTILHWGFVSNRTRRMFIRENSSVFIVLWEDMVLLKTDPTSEEMCD